MWRILCALAMSLSLWLPAPVKAQADAKLEQQLTETLKQFLYGASINDPEAHARFWADGLTYTSSRGTRYDKATLMEGLKGAEAMDPEQVDSWYSAEDVQIKKLGDVVVVNFTLIASSDDKVTDRFYNSGVFVFRDDRWQAINWNATVAVD